MKKRSTVSPILRICIAAMLVAMSVVIGTFCKTYLNWFGGMVRITFAAVGAQLPFSIKPMVLFWKLRSVKWSMKVRINGNTSAL